MSETTVAVDAMGGDHGPAVTVRAAAEYLKQDAQTRLILVGMEDRLAPALSELGGSLSPRLRVHHATEVVGMDEAPAFALRNKKDSSMRVAVNLVRSGEAQACVSAGNTGALMAISRFVLKTLPRIERPAIATELPTLRGHTYVLDLGANVDCTATHLFQFAQMGAMLASTLENGATPSVGLLNIGAEAIKGNEVVKQAAELLRASPLNFYGNVEGDDIYKGTTDVVVCDGFVGNVALKTSEGLAQMIARLLREEFERNALTRLAGVAALPVLRSLKKRLDHRQYNGASLLGLRGIVIKSHGSADCFAFKHAIDRAVREARNGLVGRIAAQIATATEVAA